MKRRELKVDDETRKERFENVHARVRTASNNPAVDPVTPRRATSQRSFQSCYSTWYLFPDFSKLYYFADFLNECLFHQSGASCSLNNSTRSEGSEKRERHERLDVRKRSSCFSCLKKDESLSPERVDGARRCC
mgnify:FL=1